jgi:hypothetical protein
MRRVCALCGHRHHAAEACPCPRCAFQHADSDCLAVEQWQYHISDGSFKLFVGCYCIICGHVHDIEGDCPSDHDHCYYTRCDRLSEIGLCAFCNVRHDETCVCYIASCCCFCGEVHDASTPCPCPLCLRLHVGGECRLCDTTTTTKVPYISSSSIEYRTRVTATNPKSRNKKSLLQITRNVTCDQSLTNEDRNVY